MLDPNRHGRVSSLAHGHKDRESLVSIASDEPLHLGTSLCATRAAWAMQLIPYDKLVNAVVRDETRLNRACHGRTTLARQDCRCRPPSLFSVQLSAVNDQPAN